MNKENITYRQGTKHVCSTFCFTGYCYQDSCHESLMIIRKTSAIFTNGEYEQMVSQESAITLHFITHATFPGQVFGIHWTLSNTKWNLDTCPKIEHHRRHTIHFLQHIVSPSLCIFIEFIDQSPWWILETFFNCRSKF